MNEYSYTKNNPVRYVDPEGEFNFETNQVEEGDTLSGVFGNNWQEVANYNNLENPNFILPGQHINIPEFVQKNFWQNMADIVTAVLPGFSDVRDIAEVITKKDFITGRALTPGEEILSGAGAMAIGLVSGKELRGVKGLNKWLTSKVGERTDWIRWGNTLIPPKVSGKVNPVSTWGIKGGGLSKDTGYKLPFHYHIHKYNWYKPWTWFRYDSM